MQEHGSSETITDFYKFRLVRKIAEGGMATVYEAIQYGSDGFEKIVAVKTIIQDLMTHTDFVHMFIGEARLVADLIHQNIVQVYQLGKIANYYYIAMEYVHGVNLEEFLDRHFELGRRVPVDLTAFIISRCCLGLDYAHNKTDASGQALGVVHRDISPKNVMIDTQGVVKITDFGIAKAQQLMRDREGEVLLGKVEYMSPEQARLEQTDRRSDIFSLGIVMYEMLAGQNIFNEEDTRVTIKNILKKPIPPVTAYNSDVPKELSDILMKALQRDREHRYQTANAFGYALQYWMYHDRFGPTYQRLETYLKEIFPRFADPTISRSVQRPSYHGFGDTSDVPRGSP
jgi:serine/threonine-protein kinase